MFVSSGKAIYAKRTDLVELAAAIAAWRGIADWSFPASLVIAGVATISLIEIRALLKSRAEREEVSA